MKILYRYTVNWLIALVMSVAVSVTPAKAQEIDEAAKYKLHAVFLYNFISSVEWPKLVYSGNAKNIDLCIIGKDTMGAVIDTVAKKAESKGDVKINVRRNVVNGDIETCNIAYVSASEDANAVLAKTRGKPILTVSEIKGFSSNGGVIEFILKGTNVSFNVNNKNAKEYGLKISPQLLEVASEVEN
jgi:hypothetical protein